LGCLVQPIIDMEAAKTTTATHDSIFRADCIIACTSFQMKILLEKWLIIRRN